MRNRYKGPCFVCGKVVEASQGVAQPLEKGSYTHKVNCADHPKSEINKAKKK